MLRLDGGREVTDVLRSGVYALIYAEEVIYIGKAKDLNTRIYSHRNVWRRYKKGDKLPPNVRPMLFSRVHVWTCQEYALDKLERENALLDVVWDSTSEIFQALPPSELLRLIAS